MNYSAMDGFCGSVLGAESLLDGMTILHGPGGCRAVPSNMSATMSPRDFKTVEGSFFFHQPHVPCTFLDSEDYIYGASEKIGMILDILESKDCRFATVLESPGASLIGDKIQDEVSASGMDGKTAIMGKCLMSESFAHGYDASLRLISEKLAHVRDRRKGTVNLTGLPFTARGAIQLVRELHDLLGLMGIEVIADIGPGCTISQMEKSSEAEANICICPEYFGTTGAYYRDVLGIPTVTGPLGAPVGYDALRAWISAIAEALSVDPSPVLELIDGDEKDVDRTIDSSLIMAENMRYRTYSVMAESSVALPLCMFLGKRFGMAPVSVNLTETDGRSTDLLEHFLRDIGEGRSMDSGFGKEYADLMFGPGSYVEHLRENDMCSTAVDVSVPSMKVFDILPCSIMGLAGCRLLIDGVVNSR